MRDTLLIPEGKLLALQLLSFKTPEICRKKEEEIYIYKQEQQKQSKNNNTT